MITAASNQRVKNLTALVQKAKERKRQDVFIVEGSKMFLEADDKKIKEVYLSQTFYEKVNGPLAKEGEGKNQRALLAKLEETGYEVLADPLFKKVSDTQTPQGILSVVEQNHYSIEEMLKRENPLFLILEDIQDPGNLGTMFRTAEAAGASGIVMSRGTVDIYNPKTIRSTMGSVYRIPFCYEENLTEVIRRLKEQGVCTYSAHLKGEKAHYELDFRGPAAFLIGNEGKGLREETAKEADTYLKIPMQGQVESLNAAAAASVLLYEAARQRWIAEGSRT